MQRCRLRAAHRHRRSRLRLAVAPSARPGSELRSGCSDDGQCHRRSEALRPPLLAVAVAVRRHCPSQRCSSLHQHPQVRAHHNCGSSVPVTAADGYVGSSWRRAVSSLWLRHLCSAGERVATSALAQLQSHRCNVIISSVRQHQSVVQLCQQSRIALVQVSRRRCSLWA